MRIDLQARTRIPRWLGLGAPVVAFAGALLIGGLVIAILGRSPAEAFSVYFVQPLSEGWSLQEIAVKASPLVLMGIGLSFCFRANLWNIGAEGQFIAGGALGGWLALATHNGALQGTLGGSWILPAMLVLGALGGAGAAMVPALLRVWLGVSEILTSLMLVYVAELLLDYMARGPLRDPAGFNFPQSVGFDEAARQREPQRRRRRRALGQQHPAGAEHRDAGGKERPVRIGARARQAHTCCPPLMWISAPCT